ncbi:MAG: insulinase family protein [Acidobacteria bacterium]|nr:insulinase family protein [Acidobacteriota bacterium]
MRRRLRITAGFLVLAGLGFVLSAAAGGFDELEKRVVEKTLPNGIHVILLPRGTAPVVTFVTYADVGSVDEEMGRTGLAHMFEHMAFKGSDTVGTRDVKKELKAIEREDEAYLALRAERLRGRNADPEALKRLEEAFETARAEAAEYSNSAEFGEIVERSGCPDLNAYTSLDQTVYPYSLPSNKIELWAALESDRFTNPVLREFYQERDVVMEERRMRYESNPSGKLFEEFLGVAYKAHPYGSIGIGHMSDLQNLTRRQAEEWFAKYYKGRNLVLAVVGDVAPVTAMPIIEKHFSRVPPGEKTPAVVTREPEQKGERRTVIEDPSQPILYMGFHKPDINHPDNAAYEVLSGVLSNGRTSRLYRSLVKEKQLALAAGSFTGLGEKYPGVFLFYAVPNKDRTNGETEAAIWAELDRVREEAVPEEELAAYKARARAAFYGQLQSNQGIAIQLAENQALRGSWRAMFRNQRDLQAVTPADLQRVARETFRRTNLAVAEIRTTPAEN